VSWRWVAIGFGVGLLGAASYAVCSVALGDAPTLDRAQAAFETDDSWEQGRGYNWAKFRAEAELGTLVCTDAGSAVARVCTVSLLTVDPKDGRPLGVSPETFVCTPLACAWLR